MTTPAKINFTLKGNSQFERVWQITNNGSPVDISTYTFELEVKVARGLNSKRILNLTIGSGLSFEDAVNGKLRISIPPQTSIVTTTAYVYDFIMIKSSKPYVLIEGTMTIEPGVSYSGS
jgi:hypothetical protein